MPYRVPCHICGEDKVLELHPEDVEEYLSPNRRYVQDIFPYLNAEERELLISRTCPKCWEKMFALPDEDDVEEAIEQRYKAEEEYDKSRI